MYSYNSKPVNITIADRHGVSCTVEVPRERIEAVFARQKSEVLTGHISKSGGLDSEGQRRLLQLHNQNPRLGVLSAALEEIGQMTAKKEDELVGVRRDLARERESETPIKKEIHRQEKRVERLFDEIRQLTAERADSVELENEMMIKAVQIFEGMTEAEARKLMEMNGIQMLSELDGLIKTTMARIETGARIGKSVEEVIDEQAMGVLDEMGADAGLQLLAMMADQVRKDTADVERVQVIFGKHGVPTEWLKVEPDCPQMAVQLLNEIKSEKLEAALDEARVRQTDVMEFVEGARQSYEEAKDIVIKAKKSDEWGEKELRKLRRKGNLNAERMARLDNAGEMLNDLRQDTELDEKLEQVKRETAFVSALHGYVNAGIDYVDSITAQVSKTSALAAAMLTLEEMKKKQEPHTRRKDAIECHEKRLEGEIETLRKQTGGLQDQMNWLKELLEKNTARKIKHLKNKEIREMNKEYEKELEIQREAERLRREFKPAQPCRGGQTREQRMEELEKIIASAKKELADRLWAHPEFRDYCQEPNNQQYRQRFDELVAKLAGIYIQNGGRLSRFDIEHKGGPFGYNTYNHEVAHCQERLRKEFDIERLQFNNTPDQRILINLRNAKNPVVYLVGGPNDSHGFMYSGDYVNQLLLDKRRDGRATLFSDTLGEAISAADELKRLKNGNGSCASGANGVGTAANGRGANGNGGGNGHGNGRNGNGNGNGRKA